MNTVIKQTALHQVLPQSGVLFERCEANPLFSLDVICLMILMQNNYVGFQGCAKAVNCLSADVQVVKVIFNASLCYFGFVDLVI